MGISVGFNLVLIVMFIWKTFIAYNRGYIDRWIFNNIPEIQNYAPNMVEMEAPSVPRSQKQWSGILRVGGGVKYVVSSPLPREDASIWLYNIVQMGWNHHLGEDHCSLNYSTTTNKWWFSTGGWDPDPFVWHCEIRPSWIRVAVNMSTLNILLLNYHPWNCWQF